jgi:hypothetical protein
MKLFKDIVEAAVASELPVVNGQQYTMELLKANTRFIEKLMSTRGEALGMPKVSMKEALTAGDASILFRKVINDTLVRPIEPQMVFSTRLAKTVTVDNARSVSFPAIGTIRAQEISDTGDYPEAHPGFTDMSTEIKVKKFGLAVPIGEDIINDSQWDIVALFLEAARYAMARLKEEMCANEFATNSTKAFDNKLGTLEAQTTGRSAASKFNGTLSFRDVIDALGAMVTNEYSPTDISVHPMMWSVFAKDPILQFLMLQNGQAVQTVGDLGPNSIKANMPWAFNVNVSPFITYTIGDTVAGFHTDPANSATTADQTGVSTTDMYISDRNNSLVILAREALSVEQFDDPYRDIRRIRCKERYGVGTLNNGKAVVSIKNIVLGENVEPIYTVRTTSI